MISTSIINILLSALFYFTQPEKESIILKAELANREVTKKEDLFVTLRLTNRAQKKIAIYRYDGLTYQLPCVDLDICISDFFFIIEQKKKGAYIEPEKLANIEELPMLDSLGNNLNEQLDTLNAGHSKTQIFNILGYYRLQKGEYRVKFSYKVPSQNNNPSKIIYSNWLLFKVKSGKVEYTY